LGVHKVKKVMIAVDIINHMIPPLKLKDTGKRAMVWMEELRVQLLPVTDQGRFLGFLTEEIILESNDDSLLIAQYDLEGNTCFLRENNHIYDVIRVASQNDLSTVAVLNDADAFVGVIAMEDTLKAIASNSALQESGAVIVLQIPSIDFSLAEISRIVEGENARILSTSAAKDNKDHSLLTITLKLNQTEVSHIIATLERFGYQIIGRFQEEGINTNEQDRYNMLMKYLNI